MRTTFGGVLAKVLFAGAALAAMGQAPATRSGARAGGVGTPGAANGSAGSLAKNIDRALQDLITLDADGIPLAAFLDTLRQTTQTNITVNWNALAAAGVARDAPVTLHLKDVPCEAAIRALMEVLPAAGGGGANYTVGDNILDITTNAELGKLPVARVRRIDRVLAYSLESSLMPEERTANGKLMEQVITAELRRAGEPMEAKGHSVAVKDGSLAEMVSERGLTVVERATAAFNTPVKVGQVAAGMQLTARAKRTADAMKDASIVNAGNVGLAREPASYQEKISTALLPGTAEELTKAMPQLESAITDGGILMIGPRAAIRGRTAMAVYDLREVMVRVAAKNKTKPMTAMDAQAAVVQLLQQTVKPDGDGTWLTLEGLTQHPKASALQPYNGLLIVFATAPTQRAVSAALQTMGR